MIDPSAHQVVQGSEVAATHEVVAAGDGLVREPVSLARSLAQPQLESNRLAYEARMVQRAQHRRIRDDGLQRGFDVLVASVLLLAVAPLMLVVSLLILLSRGPVLFRQTRVGRCGQLFTCLKFRTMVPDAAATLEKLLANDPDARAAWASDFKLVNDPRITRVGNFLRKTSLDELPQLINVLRGDMSLVGPRPVVPEELGRYGDYAQVVLQVRPGMTGAWQVNGRNTTTYMQRIKLDVDYALHRTLTTDINILFKTIRAVINPEPDESR